MVRRTSCTVPTFETLDDGHAQHRQLQPSHTDCPTLDRRKTAAGTYYGYSRRGLVGGSTFRRTPISRCPLDKNPMPGHLSECLENPTDRGAWRATTGESQSVGHNRAHMHAQLYLFSFLVLPMLFKTEYSLIMCSIYTFRSDVWNY